MKADRVDRLACRKKDHIYLSLKSENTAHGGSGFQHIRLLHSALPEIDFSEVDISTQAFGKALATPFVVTGMTGGWEGSLAINQCIADVCERRGWIMGIGSQRRQILDSSARKEAQTIRQMHPGLILMGNIGLSQLIQTPLEQVEEMIQSLKASAMVVHANALQEVLQPEGTPQFRGGQLALSRLCQQCSVPVILKETGCGFSKKTLQAVVGMGLFAIDVSGYGGTHWGRIEGQRIKKDHPFFGAGDSFKNWGIPTVDSLLAGSEISNKDYELWAGGGIRNGVDAAKALSLGADRVGVARTVIQSALEGASALEKLFSRMEYELKVALFCLGCRNINDIRCGKEKKWEWS